MTSITCDVIALICDFIKEWRINDKLHRIGGGPAYLQWFDNGNIYQEEWHGYNELYRGDGPAFQCWRDDGVLHYHSPWA